MSLIEKLTDKWKNITTPFLIHEKGELSFNDVINQSHLNLSQIQTGDVVALIGDFDPQSISTLLHLIDKNVVIVPLTGATRTQHEYFFDAAHVNVVIEGDTLKRFEQPNRHDLVKKLRDMEHSGLVLFSTGTTGRPKAILHDMTLFLKRFNTPRPTLKTLNFLLFDHIGGINTLLHTLFNTGCVISTNSRKVEDILSVCKQYDVEVLPTTPTFLRMMLMSGLIPEHIPESLKIITYGTERMDQPTLDALCKLLPNIDFRQTFGMSELGIVRVKSKARDSLFMKIGGEGVAVRVKNNILEIKSDTRMVGYMNAEDPFDDEGWYNTKDIVEEDNGYYKVTGRTTEVINVGGLKFMASEVERITLQFEGIKLAKAQGKANPITGQHVELMVQPNDHTEIRKSILKDFLSDNLQPHMMPKRIKIDNIAVGHRFKRS